MSSWPHKKIPKGPSGYAVLPRLTLGNHSLRSPSCSPAETMKANRTWRIGCCQKRVWPQVSPSIFYVMNDFWSGTISSQYPALTYVDWYDCIGSFIPFLLVIESITLLWNLDLRMCDAFFYHNEPSLTEKHTGITSMAWKLMRHWGPIPPLRNPPQT